MVASITGGQQTTEFTCYTIDLYWITRHQQQHIKGKTKNTTKISKGYEFQSPGAPLAWIEQVTSSSLSQDCFSDEI